MVNSQIASMAVDGEHNLTSSNMTSDVSADHYNQELSPGISAAGATLGILVIGVGTFGNVLVILAVVLSRPLLKASNMFIVSLAVCDLFQTVMVRPLYLHTYVHGKWEFGAHVCLYALYASNLAILESILHVLAIAFYRYIILVHPTAAHKFQSPKAVVILILLIYIGPLMIILLPSLPKLKMDPIMYTDVSFNTHIMFCAYNKSNNKTSFSGSITGIVKKSAFLLIAASFLFYFYIRIYHVVRSSGRSVHNTLHGSSASQTRLRREVTLLKTVIAVFFAFVISYLPVTVLYAVDKASNLPDPLYLVAVLLLWSSSSINWMIYGLMNKQFLQGYRYVLCGFKYYVNNTTENGSGSKISMRGPLSGPRRNQQSNHDSSPELVSFGSTGRP